MDNDKDIREIVRKNRERMLTAARLEEPDEVPVWLVWQPYYHTPVDRSEYGTSMVYFFPDILLERMEKLWRRHRGQAYIGPEFGVVIEATGFGGVTRWPFDLSEKQVIFPCVRTPEDVAALQVPDPCRDGLMGAALEMYRYMKYKRPELPISMPIWPRGPFTLACMLTIGLLPGAYFTDDGMDLIRGWMRDKSDVLHLLLEKCTKTLINWIKAQWEVAEEDHAFLLADDETSFITTEQFKEFALPYLQRIFTELDHPLNAYHNCHDANHLLELIPETKAHIFHSGPRERCDFFKAKELIGDRICLMGNISCYDLPKKSVSEVEEECREVIEKCAPGGGLILAPSTTIVPETPPENIDAILDSAAKYGKYPIGK